MIDFLHSVIAEQQKKLENNSLASPLDESSPSDAKLPTKPPRLYCDVCERFDEHDTEDCPLQSGEMTQSGEVIVNNQKRKAPPPPRPFCTTCEVWGHEAANCISDLTF